jgi:hypothetical protein
MGLAGDVACASATLAIAFTVTHAPTTLWLRKGHVHVAPLRQSGTVGSLHRRSLVVVALQLCCQELGSARPADMRPDIGQHAKHIQ